MSINQLELIQEEGITLQDHERRPVPTAERLSMLVPTLNEIIKTSFAATKTGLQLVQRGFLRTQDEAGSDNIDQLIERIAVNQRIVEQIETQVVTGQFDKNPQAGIDAWLGLNPLLIHHMRRIDRYITNFLLVDPSQNPRITQRLLYQSGENVEQLHTLGIILRLPEHDPIYIYHGYSKVRTLLIARKHFPKSMLKAA